MPKIQKAKSKFVHFNQLKIASSMTEINHKVG